MTLTKGQLTEIVSGFGHLIDGACSDEFCWDTDVGKTDTPLGFAGYCVPYCDNLVAGLREHVENHVSELSSAHPYRMEDRDFDNVVDDILRNIAIDAQAALES